jgi:nucleotide-binding universal stress UspA family protein
VAANGNALSLEGVIMITASRSPVQKDTRSGLGPVGLRFRSILVATDCSPASTSAVKAAARLAKEFHARLYVLHAIVPEQYAVNLRGPFPELELMNLKTAHENLHKYAEHIPELRTVKHKEIVFLGSPDNAIQSAGEANGIDLLVLGSHGRQGIAKLTLGSIAEWAIRRLHYPVMVAGPLCDKRLLPIRSVVLATDLTDQALRSAQYASSIAQDYNARLTVVNVLGRGGAQEEQTGAELSTEDKLHQVVPSDCGEWCSLKFEVRGGEIAPAILQSAQENKANLVVLSARRRPALADHMPRTKLSAIIRGSHCPVLVAPAHVS